MHTFKLWLFVIMFCQWFCCSALTIGEQWLRIISIEIPNLPKLAEALKEVLEENMESSEKATQVSKHFICLTLGK